MRWRIDSTAGRDRRHASRSSWMGLKDASYTVDPFGLFTAVDLLSVAPELAVHLPNRGNDMLMSFVAVEVSAMKEIGALLSELLGLELADSSTAPHRPSPSIKAA